ncbi:hypothetical protein [Actinomadura sp. B10D3]|uniref:hypothetical protein n=1 Tax=Actinomadura sp. B10D3 TaxID=3153557 RepID=UPI00325E3633
MAGCCLSVIVSSLRGTVSGSMWSTRIAPAIAGTGLVIIGGIIVAHYQDVTGSDSPYIFAMPLILVAGAAYGALAIRRDPDIRLENYVTE